MKKKNDKLQRSMIYRGFRKVLIRRFEPDIAEKIWSEANARLCQLERMHPNIKGENKLLVLPAAALNRALRKHTQEQALDLLTEYGTAVGRRIAKIVHALTSIPGVPMLLWKNMPTLMRKMSSPEKGYTRKIISETDRLVAVDILSCPLHDAAVKIGVPESARVICAMDKAYMTGFKHIRYTRTMSVAEGDRCCDYRLLWDETLKSGQT